MTLQGRRGGTENGVVSFGLHRKGRQTVDLIDLKVGLASFARQDWT